MTKLAIAAIALGLAGAGALAAVGVKRLSCGECPLTGAPIGHHAPSPVAVPLAGSAAYSAEGSATATSAAPDADAEQCPAAAAKRDCESQCEDNQQLDCCRKKLECGNCPKAEKQPETTERP